MPKYDPAAVDTTGLDLTKMPADEIPDQGELDEHPVPSPKGFTPDEDYLEPGVNPDELGGDA